MNNTGPFAPLASLSILAPMAQSRLTPIVNLDGMLGVTLTANFKYGSGGATCTAIVATTLDGGTVWYQVARWDFAMLSRSAYCNLTAGVAGITAYADLASEGVNNNLLGNQLALLLSSTGTYASTVLDVRACPR
jgi:hypothetical protein